MSVQKHSVLHQTKYRGATVGRSPTGCKEQGLIKNETLIHWHWDQLGWNYAFHSNPFQGSPCTGKFLLGITLEQGFFFWPLFCSAEEKQTSWLSKIALYTCYQQL